MPLLAFIFPLGGCVLKGLRHWRADRCFAHRLCDVTACHVQKASDAGVSGTYVDPSVSVCWCRESSTREDVHSTALPLKTPTLSAHTTPALRDRKRIRLIDHAHSRVRYVIGSWQS